MSIANRILKILYDKKVSINQLCKIIDTEPQSTIYGRISELKSRKLIKKIDGKFTATESGKVYINKLITSLKYYTDWNYLVNNKLKILASDKEQAYRLAKLIYGSDAHIKQIE